MPINDKNFRERMESLTLSKKNSVTERKIWQILNTLEGKYLVEKSLFEAKGENKEDEIKVLKLRRKIEDLFEVLEIIRELERDNEVLKGTFSNHDKEGLKREMKIKNLEGIIERERGFFDTEEKKFRTLEKENETKQNEITNLQSELQMEREEAAKALEKAKEWRERQIKELTDRKEQEKTEAIRKSEGEKQEKINQLNTKIRELEQAKEQIRNQVLQERGEWENKLRDKINGKLENRLFKPNEKGKDLEQATDNLLEKQGKLENQIYNLEKDIQQISKQLREEKEKVEIEKQKLKNRIDKIIGDKNAWFNYESESLDVAIDKLFGNHQIYVESTGDKCVRVVTAPFKWTAGKIGTGFALAGFMAAIPAICGAIGWGLKTFLAVKTGGVGGAVMVANSMINHRQNNQGGNLPPNYQPLLQGNNNVNNQLLPAGENTANLPPVINNHYHNLPSGENKKNRRKRKRTDNF